MFSRFLKRKQSPIFYSFIVTTAGSGISKLLLVLLTFYCSNTLSQYDFGAFSFVRNTLNMILCICALNYMELCTKFTVEASHSNKAALRLALLMMFSLSICLLFGFCLFLLPQATIVSIVSSYELIPYFRVIGVLLAVFMLQPLIEGILRGYKSFKLIGVLQIISAIAFIVFSVVGIQVAGIDGALCAIIAYYVFYSTISSIAVIREKGLYKKEKMKELCYRVKHCLKEYKILYTMILPVFLMSFLEAPVNWWAQVLLSKYGTFEAVGVMTVILQIRNMLMLLPSYFFSTFSSFAASLNAEKNYVDYFSKFRRTKYWLLLGSLGATFLFCLMNQFILSLFGSNYMYASLPYYIGMLGLPFLLIGNFLKVNLIIREHQRLMLMISILSNLLFIVTLYGLLWNSIECVTAFFISQAVQMIFVYIVCEWKYRSEEKHCCCQNHE